MITTFFATAAFVAVPGLVAAFLASLLFDDVSGALLLTFGSATAIGAGAVSGLVAAVARWLNPSILTRHARISVVPIAVLCVSVFPAQLIAGAGRITLLGFVHVWFLYSSTVYAAAILFCRYRDAHPVNAADNFPAGSRPPESGR